MNARTNLILRRRQGGQTVIMALLVLGVLLILGFVFLGLVNRNIQTSQRIGVRSASNDLAEAGVRFAHNQLLTSAEGADWRGQPNRLAETSPNFTRDPDAFYLRPGSGFGIRNDSDPQRDLGGPDGLGPFIRVEYPTGRALVRVRYGAPDAGVFSAEPTGPLRRPGQVRPYLIIESVGRDGRVNANDPTTLGDTTPIQYRGYANGAAMRNALQLFRSADSQIVTGRRLMAFASMGITETARFITNKNKVSRPAEIGVPTELGAVFSGDNVRVPALMGTRALAPDLTAGAGQVVDIGGSLHSNASLLVHGTMLANLNAFLGDRITVAGGVRGADDSAILRLNVSNIDRTTGLWAAPSSVNLTNNGPLSMNSWSSNFSTAGGLFLDGNTSTDSEGYTRGVGRKEPPLIDAADPQTGLSRYLLISRESGVQTPSGNSGRFGHGQGVFVDNGSDRQTRLNEQDRVNLGTEESLFNDWLNPNNDQPNSGWQGPYYIPRAASIFLTRDGFTIVRDMRAPDAERTWRRPDGSDTGMASIRYRLGTNSNGRLALVNTFTPGVNINATLLPADFDRGQPFNGVLYFDGNVRVRGVIPTDVQLTLVSNATIYIDGSVTKGVTLPSGARLTRPSRSMLALLARDYVAVNTSMFFGPVPTQVLEEVADNPTATGYNPVRMRTPGGQIALQSEFVLDPTGPGANPSNPSTWRPYLADYAPFGSPGLRADTQMLLVHTMDDGPGESAMIGLHVNRDSGAAYDYLFPRTATNLAAGFFPGTGNVPVYGMGLEAWQRYGKFEGLALTLASPSFLTTSTGVMNTTGAEGPYALFTTDTNVLTFRHEPVGGSATNDWLLARLALAPHDVRIEATIYAQEGSFFVIPGPWFNPNPNDRRDTYASLGASDAERAAARLEAYGATPNMPFFGEPLDVRVVISGAVSENMPPPISQQAEWIRKWGWIPGTTGATGQNIPAVHVPGWFDLNSNPYVPNLLISYDPVLASGRATGFDRTNDPATLVRVDDFGRALPPMPRLPVSPVLAYFGEVK